MLSTNRLDHHQQFKDYRSPTIRVLVRGDVCRIRRDNEGQLLDVQDEPLHVLPPDRRQVGYFTASQVNPQVTRVHSLETVPTEGARLGPRSPENYGIVLVNS